MKAFEFVLNKCSIQGGGGPYGTVCLKRDGRVRVAWQVSYFPCGVAREPFHPLCSAALLFQLFFAIHFVPSLFNDLTLANKRQGFDPYSTISRGTRPKGSYDQKLLSTGLTTDSEYKKLRELRELYYFNTKEKRIQKQIT